MGQNSSADWVDAQPRSTEFLQVNWGKADKTVPYQHSNSVKDALPNGKPVQCVTHITQNRGIFTYLGTPPMRRAAERWTLSRRAVIVRSRPTKTEQQRSSRLVTKAWTKVAAAS